MKDKQKTYQKLIRTTIASIIAIVLCNITLAADRFERVCLFMVIFLCAEELMKE